MRCRGLENNQAAGKGGGCRTELSKLNLRGAFGAAYGLNFHLFGRNSPHFAGKDFPVFFYKAEKKKRADNEVSGQN